MLSNKPFYLGKLAAFRENPFTVNIELPAGYEIVTPVGVEYWAYDQDQGLDIPIEVTGQNLSFTLTVEQLRLVDSADLFITFDTGVDKRYKFHAPVSVSLDSSLPTSTTFTVNFEENGPVKVSIWSDAAAALEANAAQTAAELAASQSEAILADVEVIKTDIDTSYAGIQGVVTTPEMEGAIGDGTTDDSAAVNAAFATGKEIYLKGDYLANSFDNPQGGTFIGNGKILKQITGGKTQINTRHDLVYEFGWEQLHAWYRGLLNKDAMTVIFAGDSTTVGSNTTTGNNITDIFREGLIATNIKNVSVVNGGVGGTHEGNWIGATLAGQLAQNPKLLIVSYGINSLYTPYGRTWANFIADYEEGLRQARDTTVAGKSVKDMSIIIMSPQSATDAVANRDPKVFETMRLILRSLAEKYKCAFIDQFAYTRDSLDKYLIGWDGPYGDNLQRTVHGDNIITHIRASKLIDLCLLTSYKIRLASSVTAEFGPGGKNYFDVSRAIDGYSLLNGAPVANAPYSYTEYYIPVTAGQVWTGRDEESTPNPTRFISYYNSSKVYVSQVSSPTTTWTIPGGTVALMRVTVVTAGKNSYQLELGSVHTATELYTKQLISYDGGLVGGVSSTEKNTWNEKYGETDLTIVAGGKNWYDPSRVIDGIVLNAGVPASSPTNSTIDYRIPVIPGQVWTGRDDTPGTYVPTRWITYYTAGGAYLSEVSTSQTTWTVPALAYYMVVTVPIVGKPTYMLELWGSHTTYEAFIPAFSAIDGYLALPGTLRNFDFSSLPTFADDAAAAAGGLRIGQGYFAAGVFKRREA